MAGATVELKVEQKHIDAARAAGACELPDVGTPVSHISNEHLHWFIAHCPEMARDIERIVKMPLWALSDSGSGDGDGYGDGYGDGSGDGNGDGYGYGSGDGNGDGNGYGYGSGDGYGYGHIS